MTFPSFRALRAFGFVSFFLAAPGCSSGDPTGSGGTGTVDFTTWGETLIEERIPPENGDEGGFTDGWALTYSKFLVNFGSIELLSSDGGFRSTRPRLFDNKLPGVKLVERFEGVPAQAYPNVSYEIAPVSEETLIAEGVSEADKQRMLESGYSLWLEGTAEKAERVKAFAWGFTLNTRYERCHSQQGGRDELGLVVTNESTVEAQLTTHGDHPFYDRLEESENPAVMTSLRFDAMADADADDDGVVTLDELDATPLDVRRYNPSSLSAATLGEFVRRLARTVGHFRGEGECSIVLQ